MGAVLATLVLAVGEDLVRFLPLVAILLIALWFLLTLTYGGCVPFCNQLARELRELVGRPGLQLQADDGARGAELLLPRQRGTASTGLRWWGAPAATRPQRFPIQQPLVNALTRLSGQGVAVPNEYVCPITLEVMRDPVTAADGHTYEYEAIQRSIRGGNMNSPMTGRRLGSLQLVENHALRTLIVAAGEAALAQEGAVLLPPESPTKGAAPMSA